MEIALLKLARFGRFLQFKKKSHSVLTLEQLGTRATPTTDPDLMFVMPDILGKLEAQLAKKRAGWGRGKTLVFSMLTDGFSPELIRLGTTEKALRMVLKGTDFRIRVLTKNSIVGTERWTSFFSRYPGRFVVGLSCGTLDDGWARKVEVGTSKPSARLRALRSLQDARIPTFGMLCPIFPDVLSAGDLERLVDEVRPNLVEHLWAEPFNDRQNWEVVRDSYDPGSDAYQRLGEMYESKERGRWSAYATELYTRLRDRAGAQGWLHKLRFLLYESAITERDADAFRGLEGVLLQSKPDDDGKSKNPHIRALQYSPESS